ncbi:MAG: histidine kinase dimerization/phospho-acceptor domain-containing protein, partial [Sphingomicrobium sp.]
MLHQDLPALDASPLHGEARWLIPAIGAAAGFSGAGLLWAVGFPLAAGGFLAACAIAVALAVRAPAPGAALDPFTAGPDFSIIGSALALAGEAAALTAADGTLLIANAAYRARFDGAPRPAALGSDDDAMQALAAAQAMAWRDGGGCACGVRTAAGSIAVEVERVGVRGDLLLWRFPEPAGADPMALAAERVTGTVGERLGHAAVLAALVDGDGKLIASNRLFADRALNGAEPHDQPSFTDLVEVGDDGQFRLIAEGDGANLMRAVHIPADPTLPGGAGTFLLFDGADPLSTAGSTHLQALLDMLPIGLALVDRDGRFLTMNDAFRTAGGLKPNARPVYPGDLVVKEDKAAVADTVRRNARGPAMSGDLAIRLARTPAEPVALTVAGLRGLGDAAVLLLLKDNSEEAKLKRQIAQATKMQAVGQLAGGVAHDFNNILTAIIGHCDLMLMRHTPGDSDYDDIQQIKSNSNRAAGLTRQLLAFSRQQTLRPQVLQLPDVVSEVSHLLKRLLGETVQLAVKHGRNLGPIRADPGQLEQVIVNLAVNARDAI